MKIGKTFSMTVSGKYQSYVFSTALEVDNVEDIASEAEPLANAARKSTFDDIERLAKENEEFRLVLGARREELANYRRLLEGKERAAQSSAGKFNPVKRSQ